MAWVPSVAPAERLAVGRPAVGRPVYVQVVFFVGQAAGVLAAEKAVLAVLVDERATAWPQFAQSSVFG